MVNKDPSIRIKRDNSNIYLHSTTLSDDLKKYRYKKVKLQPYIEFQKVVSQLGSDPYEDIDFIMDLKKFFLSLPHIYVEVFTLHFIEGCNQEEIAEELGKSQGWVSLKVTELETLFYEYYYEGV